MSALSNHFSTQRQTRVLMLGLDSAGKSTLLLRLKDEGGGILQLEPTSNFAKTLHHGELFITAWDVSAQDKRRALWRHYFQSTDALVFVVDSTDRARLAEAREELHSIVNDAYMDDQNPIVLVLANKADLPGALGANAIGEALTLKQLRFKWNLQATSAKLGTGVSDGLEWLRQEARNSR